jgi:hypothetical protein
VVSVMDPYGCLLGFLDRKFSSYLTEICFILIITTRHLKLLREITAVYFENNIKHINTHFERNSEFKC